MQPFYYSVQTHRPSRSRSDLRCYQSAIEVLLSNRTITMEKRSAALVGLAGILYSIKSIGWPLKTATWLGAWLASGGRKWLYLFWHTWRRDAV